eukprot:Colp12_sorted_trinity150504_noHs@13364
MALRTEPSTNTLDFDGYDSSEELDENKLRQIKKLRQERLSKLEGLLGRKLDPQEKVDQNILPSLDEYEIQPGDDFYTRKSKSIRSLKYLVEANAYSSLESLVENLVEDEDKFDEVEDPASKQRRQRRMKKLKQFFGDKPSRDVLIEQNILKQLEDEIDEEGKKLTAEEIKQLKVELANLRRSMSVDTGRPVTGKLTLKVIAAKNLIPPERGNTKSSDPYLVVKVDGMKVVKTGVKKQTLSPVWNEEHHIYCNSARVLDLIIWDKDQFSDELMATVRLQLEEFMDEARHKETWVDLTPQGQLQVNIKFEKGIDMGTETMLIVNTADGKARGSMVRKLVKSTSITAKDYPIETDKKAKLMKRLAELQRQEEQEIERVNREYLSTLSIIRRKYQDLIMASLVDSS